VTKELQRRSVLVNHKKVLSIMQAEQLLCKRGKRRKISTTNSDHANRVYPNLIGKLEPSRPDQVWQADLTYIRSRSDLFRGCCYGRRVGLVRIPVRWASVVTMYGMLVWKYLPLGSNQ
jgi:putative transposase